MEIVRHPLHHGRDPFEAGASVHARLRQRLQHAIRLTVELHENEVPDFQEASGFGAFDEGILGVIRNAGVGPLAGRPCGEGEVLGQVRQIDVDLGARSAGAGIGHLPEVVGVAESIDA